MDGPDQASQLSGMFGTKDRVLAREPNVTGQERWFEFESDGIPVAWWSLPVRSNLLASLVMKFSSANETSLQLLRPYSISLFPKLCGQEPPLPGREFVR